MSKALRGGELGEKREKAEGIGEAEQSILCESRER
jgi:hypothetical protein